MELKDFIEQSLIQIVDGVRAAQEHAIKKALFDKVQLHPKVGELNCEEVNCQRPCLLAQQVTAV